MLPLGVRPIDCDVHVSLPDTRTLLPYLDEYWREHLIRRGIDRDSLELTSYPSNAPLTCRPDWRPSQGHLGSQFEQLRDHVLEPFQTQFAICNVLHGSQIMFSEDLSAAMCRAINDWIAAEFLDRDTRLRASIVVPLHSPELAAAEVERRATDRRFVQVLMLAMTEMPLGKRQHWPIYAAAERHDLPIGIHAGSSFRHPPSSLGWPSYYIEDYVSQAPGFSGVLNSLVAEGVFNRFPRLKVVLIESGVTWLPAHFWRIDKTWRAVRYETPWVKRRPSEIIREHVRLTVQPFDAPPTAAQVQMIIDEIGSDEMLLFSTDYPHWHFEGADAIPNGLPDECLSKMLVSNALATYPRLS
ncbi:amidohydrolase [Bradyrhizobium sp. CNPSo 4010]|uniref:Amidohydrolase n=1 Tax=Bradyrhizobium agreste TaxID=2751811 RepID=A0ABS0PGK4_9BRAD|nr:amidohydrolase family protein [Bradyrhizobium agreste]MBH5396263.1 amidohydrolase [Bradyrhizobium agreste]